MKNVVPFQARQSGKSDAPATSRLEEFIDRRFNQGLEDRVERLIQLIEEYTSHCHRVFSIEKIIRAGRAVRKLYPHHRFLLCRYLETDGLNSKNCIEIIYSDRLYANAVEVIADKLLNYKDPSVVTEKKEETISIISSSIMTALNKFTDRSPHMRQEMFNEIASRCGFFGAEPVAAPEKSPIHAMWRDRPRGRVTNPAKWIKEHHSDLIGAEGGRAAIRRRDPELINAYAQWIRPSRHPEDDLKLDTKPQTNLDLMSPQEALERKREQARASHHRRRGSPQPEEEKEEIFRRIASSSGFDVPSLIAPLASEKDNPDLLSSLPNDDVPKLKSAWVPTNMLAADVADERRAMESEKKRKQRVNETPDRKLERQKREAAAKREKRQQLKLDTP